MGLKTFQAQTNPKPAKYGLTGAIDNHEKPDGILTTLGVSSFVQLQPMDWNRESGKRGVTYRDGQGKEQFHEVFFFQAEDGIRDVAVTGVQTCALPICAEHTGNRSRSAYVGNGGSKADRHLRKGRGKTTQNIKDKEQCVP